MDKIFLSISVNIYNYFQGKLFAHDNKKYA